MPPEMITIVAPTAMIAKKLASVAVWISVLELRKLLTLWPGDAGPRAMPANRGEDRAQEEDHHEEAGRG